MNDIIYIVQWWGVIFLIGIISLPLTSYFLDSFYDKGYILSKVVGIALTSYLVFLLGILHIFPFTIATILFVLLLLIILNWYIFIRNKFNITKLNLVCFIGEEVLFFACLLLWAYIRAHKPDIHDLEKFMDYGFLNSILRSTYLPPADMWFPPYPINYYYFGHFTTALLTKLSFLNSSVSYNLMLATLFAFCFTAAGSLIFNITCSLYKKINKNAVIAGFLGSLLISLSGNLHILYAFFLPYKNDSPVPLWNLKFSPFTFPNSYWYPNATRFIPYTIHEFPIYSFVVADLHAHVLDIPFVILCISFIYMLFIKKTFNIFILIFQSLLLSIMYITNAWDGLLYLALTIIVLGIHTYRFIKHKTSVIQTENKISKTILKNLYSVLPLRLPIPLFSFCLSVFLLVGGFIIFTLPFSIYFKPFVSGIGIVCAPSFLIDGFSVGNFHFIGGKLGPFLFESNKEINHCQHSPLWQLLTLYGFFYFFVISFCIFMYKKTKELNLQDIFIFILILFSTLLIIVPEFIYAKDIYPQHYRANTMFKLVYQSFMMLSISSAYIAVRLISYIRKQRNFIVNPYFPFLIVSIVLIGLVMIYPYFAINSYYDNLSQYKNLNGTTYLSTLRPDDYKAIQWINTSIKGQPVILEAQGDSYTDYGRISVNTGLPTILGWTVHEWLWRGSYDIPSPRIEEVKSIYENYNTQTTKNLLKKYNVKYIYIGQLEREKYPKLDDRTLLHLGKVVYRNNSTQIIKTAL